MIQVMNYTVLTEMTDISGDVLVFENGDNLDVVCCFGLYVYTLEETIFLTYPLTKIV